MPTAHVDHRQIHYERDDEAFARIEALRPVLLDSQIELARLLARVHRSGALMSWSCRSVEELARRLGFHGSQARQLLHLGYLLAARPDVEEGLRGRTVDLEKACELGRLYMCPEALEAEPGRNWVEDAGGMRLRDLRRDIRQRIETIRQGVPCNEVYTATVSAETKEDLHRCQQVASGKARQTLTRGQALTALARHYLLSFDPMQKKRRPRRMPPTNERLYDRGVPAEVVDALWARSGGVCEFGPCEHPVVEICHLSPHRAGSPREVGDLVLGCGAHHKSYDAGWMAHAGWTDDGRPIFELRSGPGSAGDGGPSGAGGAGRTLQPKPRPRPDATRTAPAWLLRAIGRAPRKRKQASGRKRAPQGETTAPAAGAGNVREVPRFRKRARPRPERCRPARYCLRRRKPAPRLLL